MLRGEVWWVAFDPAIGSEIQTDQIMTADKKLLKTLFGKLSRENMKTVEQALKTQLGLPQ